MITYSPLNTAFDEYVAKKLEEFHVTGISVAVVQDGKVHAKGYGIASYPSEKVTPSTLFYTGSTTKAFLGALWAQLVESEENQEKDELEKIFLKTPLSKLIRDDFVLQDDWATNHITIEDALSHRTGMSRHDASYGGSVNTSKQIVRSLRHFPLTTEPRTKFEYCNIQYVAASHAFEVTTDQPLRKSLKEKIWEPLEMRNTFLDLADAKRAASSGDVNLANGFSWDREAENGKGAFKQEDHMDFSYIAGAGAIISNVLDYANWLIALMSRSAPLSEKIVTTMRTPRAIVSEGDRLQPWDGTVNYALGWFLATYEGEQVIFHDGGLIGFGSSIMYLPERKWGVVLMGNTGVTSNTVATFLRMYLVDKLLGVPAEKSFDNPAKSGDLLNSIKPKDPKTVDEVYPSIVSPALPPSLPIGTYAGTYHHPGYRSISFEVQDYEDETSLKTKQVLFANLEDRCWPCTIRLEHVSGEYWVAFYRRMFITDTRKAEFRVGIDGKPAEIGIMMEVDMPDTKFWFRRIDE